MRSFGLYFRFLEKTYRAMSYIHLKIETQSTGNPEGSKKPIFPLQWGKSTLPPKWADILGMVDRVLRTPTSCSDHDLFLAKHGRSVTRYHTIDSNRCCSRYDAHTPRSWPWQTADTETLILFSTFAMEAVDKNSRGSPVFPVL